MQYILWYNFRYTCKIHCNRHIYNIISYHLFSELLHHCTFLLNESYYFYVESYIKFRSILLLLKFRTPYLCKTCKTYNNNKNYALSRKLVFKQVIRNTIACKYFLQPPQVIRRRTLHCGAWETLVRGYTSSGFSLGFFFLLDRGTEGRVWGEKRMWARRWLVAWEGGRRDGQEGVAKEWNRRKERRWTLGVPPLLRARLLIPCGLISRSTYFHSTNFLPFLAWNNWEQLRPSVVVKTCNFSQVMCTRDDLSRCT